MLRDVKKSEEIIMFDKLEDILVRFDEILKELNEPSVVNRFVPSLTS